MPDLTTPHGAVLRADPNYPPGEGACLETFGGDLVTASGQLQAPSAGTCSTIANMMRGLRVTVPQSGRLMDFHAVVASIGTGNNLRAAVYDTGEASNGNYTRLWLGETVAAAVGMLKLGDPEITVDQGQELMLAVAFSATQGSLHGRSLNSGATVLPDGFSKRGLNIRLCPLHLSSTATPPASVTNAEFGVEASCPTLLARVA